MIPQLRSGDFVTKMGGDAETFVAITQESPGRVYQDLFDPSTSGDFYTGWSEETETLP